MTARIALMALAALVACGPPSQAALERQCAERARAAAGPTGTVGLGVGSGGVATNLDVAISSDFIAGRDPQTVYDECIARRTQVGLRISTGGR